MMKIKLIVEYLKRKQNLTSIVKLNVNVELKIKLKFSF